MRQSKPRVIAAEVYGRGWDFCNAAWVAPEWRYGSLAAATTDGGRVRFTPESGHERGRTRMQRPDLEQFFCLSKPYASFGRPLRGGAGVAVRIVRHRPPPIRQRVVAPHFGPLRPVLMPWPRFEKAKLLVVHLIEFAEEFDRHAVGVLVIDRDVVPDNVTQRPPGQLDVSFGEEIAGAFDVRPVAHLEGDVMDRGFGVAQEIHRVMVAAAAQESEKIAAPIRNAKPEQ